jgi:hypothetical protein
MDKMVRSYLDRVEACYPECLTGRGTDRVVLMLYYRMNTQLAESLFAGDLTREETERLATRLTLAMLETAASEPPKRRARGRRRV